jgi:hypothetical protein
MPGMLVRLALELDCFDEEDAFWLELDTPVSFLLELELPVVVFAFCFSEEVPVETFWEELETDSFLLDELVAFPVFSEELEALDLLDEELLFSVCFFDELEAFTSSASLSSAGSSSKTESSTMCNPLRSSSPMATTSESVEQLQNDAAKINTPSRQTLFIGFIIDGSPFTPS